jgi:hypothetical protein
MVPNYAKYIADKVKIVANSKELEPQAEKLTKIIKFAMLNNKEVQEAFNQNVQRQLCLMVKEILMGEQNPEEPKGK